jgi:RNA polymerase sigma-70 factor (ECF subfamily)
MVEMTEKTQGELLVKEIPYLRAFAISLAGSITAADDLVQETLVKAWTHFDSFDTFSPGSSLRAWLITILRNTFYSNYRKHHREVQDTDGFYSQQVAVRGGQESRLEMEDFRKALDKLSPEHREVLVMIGVTELSYDEAAKICGVATGTIKSRVNRARAKLADILGLTGVEEIGPDAIDSAATTKPQSKHAS